MTNLEGDALKQFCRGQGISIPFDLERIRNGRNSAVARVHNASGQWILKHYYQNAQDGGDRRDRLGAEFAFLSFLNKAGDFPVAVPLGLDRQMHCALYSYVPGGRPNQVTEQHVAQAAAFIHDINRAEMAQSALHLLPASDACFRFSDHIQLAESRIARLMTVKPTDSIEREAAAFIAERLAPLMTRYKYEFTRNRARSSENGGPSVSSRIISPSDFGFHNVLELGGKLAFVDFEYAGWDDPVKLICDFICQPELPVSAAQAAQFTNQMLQWLMQPERVQTSVQQLLPVYRLKWCCILLNELRLDDRMRRVHAGRESEGALAAQLTKVQEYYRNHLAHLL